MKKYLFPALGVVALAALVWFFTSGETTEETTELIVPVSEGEFLMNVTATGELEAKRSEKIKGPSAMRTNQIYNTNITDLVPEGTIVEEGDYVATLDKTEVDTKIKTILNEIGKINSQLESTRIDTAITMRELRDQVVNLRFSMREKELEVEQSKFEAPMVIQRAEIELERGERDLKQLEKKVELSREKAQADIDQIMADLRSEQIKLQRLQDLAGQFTITAPKAGMVIYHRSWNGKVKAGSQIQAWNPIVASLPDLSEMVSKTYVNEVDISRIRKGQEVEVAVDAFPDETYSGVVIDVANIGEQLRNYDSKVFEVIISLNEADSILRPAMTTSNEILTDVLEDKLFIPLEALYKDSVSFVYRVENGQPVKQEVVTSWTNENEVVIVEGLVAGDRVYLTAPEGATQLKLQPLAEGTKIKAEKFLFSERAERRKLGDEKEAAVADQGGFQSNSGNDNGVIYFF